MKLQNWRTMSTPEGKVKKAVCDALTQLGIEWWRIQCGTAKVRGGYLRGNKNGTADILASMRFKSAIGTYVGPMFVWIEIKQDGGKQRSEQRDFEIERASRMHCYWLVSSVDELLSKIKASNAIG